MRGTQFRRILLAIKTPQAASLPSVAKAAQLARAYDAELELFHSVDVPLYLDPHAVLGKRPLTLQQELEEQVLTQLEAIALPLRRRGLKVRVAIACDSPAFEAVVRRALAIRADLIVAHYHAPPPRRRWLLRLNDWELVRLSPLPLLLVKDARAYRRPVMLAAVDPTHAFAKPLQLDRRILDVASSLGERLHGTVHAVHALPVVPEEILAAARASEIVTPQLLRQAQRRAARRARAHLDRLLRGRRIAPRNRHIVAGHPIDAITRSARATHSAIVVMGAISRSGFKRFLIGNTAEGTLDALGCDILVVKPNLFRNRVPRASRSTQLLAPL